MQRSPRAFRLLAFGPPEVYLGEEPVALPTKALAIVLNLSLAGDERVPRRKLAAWLWPRSESKRARHSLSQALYVIRKELGSKAVFSDPTSMRLGAALIDVVEFQESLEREDWIAAAHWYAGHFAEGFDVPDAPSFNHWVDGQRTTLARQADTLVRSLVAEGLLAEGASLAQTLIPTNQLNQDTLQVLAQSLAKRGLNAQLDALLAVCPPDVHALVDDNISIAQTRSTRAGISTPPTQFVGRKQALKWLEQRFSEAQGGSPNIAVLEGEPGIGKTAIARRFEKIVALRGGKVLSATAYAAEQNVPFGIVSQWIPHLSKKDIAGFADEPWFTVIGSVFPIRHGTQPTDENIEGSVGEWRLLESLRRMVDALAERRTLLLSVDDINLADPASVALLHYVLRRSHSSRILALGTLRSGVDFRADPVRSWATSRIFTVQGLSEPEVADWLLKAREEGSASAPELKTIMEWTGGNPLLISALLEDSRSDTWDSETRLSESIVDFFRPRLMEQASESRRLLYALAIIGEPSEANKAAEIAGLDEASLHASVDELVSASLVTLGEKLELRHGLVGDVAASLLSNLERRSLHGRAARVLAKEGQPADARVAISLDIAGSREDAYEAALRATEACDVLQARAEKEFFLKLALSNAPREVDAAEVRIRLSELLLQERRLSEALEVLEPITGSGVSTKAKTKAEAAHLKIVTEMIADAGALPEVWEKAQAVGQKLSPLEAADTYYHIASVAHDLGAGDLAVEISEHIRKEVTRLPLGLETAQRLLRPTGLIGLYKGHRTGEAQLTALPAPSENSNPVYFSQYYATKAALQVAAGRLKAAEESLTRSLAVAERYVLLDLYYSINNNLGVCLLEQGRYQLAEQAYAAALEYVGEDTAPSHHSVARDNMALLHYEMENYDAAAQMAGDVLAKRGDHQRSYRELMGLYSVLGLSCLELGNLTRCREVQRELELLLPHQNPLGHDMSYVYIFMARMLDLQKRTEESVASLRDMAHTYSETNEIARIRLELERCRLMIKAGADCSALLDQILADLEGSGAVPLIERAESLQTRSGLSRA